MKEITIKVSIHLVISFILTKLEYLASYVGGQAIPLGRCIRNNF